MSADAEPPPTLPGMEHLAPVAVVPDDASPTVRRRHRRIAQPRGPACRWEWMTTRTEARTAPAHVPPTPPPPAAAGMALTELLAALEGERRTHAATTRPLHGPGF